MVSLAVSLDKRLQRRTIAAHFVMTPLSPARAGVLSNVAVRLSLRVLLLLASCPGFVV